MDAKIGITQQDRQAVAEILSKLLADEFMLYLKIKNAHWNVEGPDFHSAHVFFEDQYNQIDEIVDSVAERIRQIGHYAPATINQFLQLTHLTEKTDHKNDSKGFMTDLLADHESIVEFIRGNLEATGNKYNDVGTNDLLTSVMENHERMSWMLRAHLK